MVAFSKVNVPRQMHFYRSDIMNIVTISPWISVIIQNYLSPNVFLRRKNIIEAHRQRSHNISGDYISLFYRYLIYHVFPWMHIKSSNGNPKLEGYLGLSTKTYSHVCSHIHIVSPVKYQCPFLVHIINSPLIDSQLMVYLSYSNTSCVKLTKMF